MLYVWGGSLQAVAVDTHAPRQAVVMAVRQEAPCVLVRAIRVSPLQTGLHPLDTYYDPPFEEQFPELFEDDDLIASHVPVEDL